MIMFRTPMRRAISGGLGLMLAAAIAAAASPAVATFVTALLGTLLVLVGLAPVTVTGRRLWRAAGERSAARALAEVDDAPGHEPVRDDVPAAPLEPVTVAEMWESV